MRSLLSLNFIPTTNNRLLTLITWFIRLLTGGVFIFSGFVKAIDPWGTLYKVNDYLGAMGLTVWPNLVLVSVFLLFGAEFIIGIFIVFGCFRRSAVWCCMAFMCVMLPLTLWIAMSNPVADCGCFGDAFIISNWATFWKNVVLTIFAVWLIRYNKKAGCLITPALQWIALVTTGVFITIIGLIGYIYQPLLDFRPYPEGVSIIEDIDEGDSDGGLIFIYEKDGIRKEFSESDILPEEEDGWKFVERRQTAKLSEPKLNESEKNLRLWDDRGTLDVTEEVIGNEGKQLLLLMPDISSVSIATTWKINSLYNWAEKNNIDMIAAVSGSIGDIENWKDLSMPEYEIYSADDTAIKEVARGNPAVVFLSDGMIVWKSSLRAINIDDFMSPETSGDPLSFGRDNRAILTNLSLLYMAVMAVLVMLSFMPKLNRVFGKKRKNKNTSETSAKTEQGRVNSEAIHDDKAHLEE